MLIVIAVGGNAILKKGDKPSFEQQLSNTAKLMEKVAVIAKSHRLVLTHGNGPQVGNILIRVEEALGKAYPLPLYACVAESQGEMGFMMEQSLQNALRKKRHDKPIASMLTRVIVDAGDTAFRNPSKPIGPFYSKKEAAVLKRKGFSVSKDPRGGYRRVVSSPKPLKIVESDAINRLVRGGIIIVAAGGGGIPVTRGGKSIDAVVDKDLASACLANSISADILLIITDVECAYLNYKTKNQMKIRKMKLKEAKRYLKDGQFPAGSMGPKIEAAADFLQSGGKRAIITDVKNMIKALDGKAGTTITRQ